MADLIPARCGFDCSTCDCMTQMGCPGCLAAGGKLFWGECTGAKCCIARGHEHCGQCADFPCTVVKEIAYHPEHGDNGKRLLTLKAWNEKGIEAWKREQHEGS